MGLLCHIYGAAEQRGRPPIAKPTYLYCNAQGETVVRPPNLDTASAGEMIGWLNVAPVLEECTVTLQGDYKGDFCGGQYTFKDGDNKCKLQKSANAAYVDYTVTSMSSVKASPEESRRSSQDDRLISTGG